ncbi:LysR family transcriptional regulator [Herbaspirillum sp. AP02]|uniref:LysR family transcriptional regulator n=1 Tax=unclassified Herbaspirillum TaxID=2624150 RepID=UPI0015D9F18D|nr:MULTISPECIES: LysR family transcriptional regulator [unclassified Herbaspirillum]MBG7622139.1 LysR family transcriptional regulator [Herbaspirillum sp. AP02]NZD69158.1 LysR family transcriptional regulator [Herbaspirillum sp. AP21]
MNELNLLNRGKSTLKDKVSHKWQIDPVSLRLFIAVCEEGSIAKAARREFIAASAISKRLAEIEQLVGTALIKRLPRGVETTEAGTVLLRHAKILIDGWESLYAELSRYGDGSRAQVTIYANVSSIHEFLPGAVVSFLKDHPSMQIKIEERLSEEIVRAVNDSTADFGVCRDLVDGGDLEMIPFRKDHLALVVSKSHFLAGLKEISFRQTINLPQVGLVRNGSLNRFLELMAASDGKKLNFRLQVPHFDAARGAIQQNVGVGILPVEAINGDVDALGLSVIPLSDSWAQRNMVICVKNRDNMSHGAKALLHHLLNEQGDQDRSAPMDKPA